MPEGTKTTFYSDYFRKLMRRRNEKATVQYLKKDPSTIPTN